MPNIFFCGAKNLVLPSRRNFLQLTKGEKNMNSSSASASGVGRTLVRPSLSNGLKHALSGANVSVPLILVSILFLLFSQALHAQSDIEVRSKYIAAIVGGTDGLGAVMALYNKNTKQFYPGRLFLDPQL